LKLQKFLFT